MVLNSKETIKCHYVCKVLEFFGTQATCWGSTWESIEVPEGQGKPGKEQFDTKLQEYIDEFTYEILRRERNNKLKQTDFLTVSDFPYPSEDIRSAWIAYRQKLRNITATETPSLDEKYQLVVTWPTPPIWPANVV
jgi:hypothetical protein|tara:strand:+ start:536 stop:940 length:405 start_codon:yes stop_codon:yes gene_type:complete